MQFAYSRKPMMLKGLRQSALVEKNFTVKLKVLEKKGVLLQLMETAAEKVETQVIQNLLTEYGDIFAEPNGLPPNRSHDHAIHLKLDSRAISIRCYRYPYFHK